MNWASWAWLGLALISVGCLDSSLVPCGEAICPRGDACIMGQCVDPAFVAACRDSDDGDDCNALGSVGRCMDGYCLTNACGNGIVETERNEQCEPSEDIGTCLDHGYYAEEGLACTSDCLFDIGACTGGICGDGVVQVEEEDCDGEPRPGASCLGFDFDRGRIGCVDDCVHDLRGCDRLRFAELPRGGPHAAKGLWGASPSNVWLVTFGGTIERFDGFEWKADFHGFDEIDILADVWGTSESNVHAVGREAILHFDGSGYSLTASTIDFKSVHGNGADNIWAVGRRAGDGVVARFDGTAWSEISAFAGYQLFAVWVADDGTVFVGGRIGGSDEDPGVLLWRQGSDWEELRTNRAIFGLWGATSSDVYAGGAETDRLQHFSGTPPQWQELSENFCDAPCDHEVVDIRVTPTSGTVYVTTNGGNILRKDESGWLRLYSGTPQRHDALWVSDDEQIFAAGPQSYVLLGDTSFFEASSQGAGGSLAVIAYSRGDAIAVGGGGFSTAVFEDGRWTVENEINLVAQLLEIGGTSPSNTLALFGGTGGLSVYRFDPDADLSAAWVDEELLPASSGPASVFEAGLWVFSDGEAVAVGNEIWRRLWLDAEWQWSLQAVPDLDSLLVGPFRPRFVDVWGASPDEIFAVGTAGTVAFFDGQTWSVLASSVVTGADIITEEELTAVWGAAADDVWVGTASGRLLHYDGQLWTAISDPPFVSRVDSISGTGPRDVFAITSDRMAHFDGIGWSEVNVLGDSGFSDIWAREDWVAFVGGPRGFIIREPGSWLARELR